MAKRQVVEVACDRCQRVETQSENELPKNEGPEFSVKFEGKKIVYGDLCRQCRRTISNHIKRLTRDGE